MQVPDKYFKQQRRLSEMSFDLSTALRDIIEKYDPNYAELIMLLSEATHKWAKHNLGSLEEGEE